MNLNTSLTDEERIILMGILGITRGRKMLPFYSMLFHSLEPEQRAISYEIAHMIKERMDTIGIDEDNILKIAKEIAEGKGEFDELGE